MPFSGFMAPGFNIPPLPQPPAAPPAGLDPEEEIEARANKYKQPPRPPRHNRSTEYIDRDIVERILADNNGQELQWLLELLEDGVRILNNTGRYIKTERFIGYIKQAQKH